MVTTTNSANLRDQIIDLKKQRNAILLVHNYQVGEIQDIADYVGDSLGLAYKAKETDADTIVFCGVHFMAETAKIVNPTKTVYYLIKMQDARWNNPVAETNLNPF